MNTGTPNREDGHPRDDTGGEDVDNKLNPQQMQADMAVAMQSMAKDLAAVGHIAELNFKEAKEVSVTDLRLQPDQD